MADISPIEKYNNINFLDLNNTKINSVKTLKDIDIDLLYLKHNDIPDLFEELKVFKSDKISIHVSTGMLTGEQIDELQKQHTNWSIVVSDY